MADKVSLIEYAGIKDGRDVTRGWVNAVGNYLPTRDSLLNLKSGGDLILYEQVAQDDQVKSCLQQRFRAVTAKDWEVIPGGEKRVDKQAAEHLKQQLEDIRWDDINEKMLHGVFYGYSAAEVLYRRDGDKVVIDDIKVRDRRRFHFDIDQKLTLKTFQSPLGETLPERKFWNFCVGADHDDEPYGRGLGHWLYWPTFFKRNGVRWWLKFIEKYAKPTRLGKYPAGATQGEKDVLWNALDSFGDDDRSMIPEGLEMLFLESARNGTVDYKALCDQMDGAIAKIILSQTMTTDDGSSKSQAEVHQDVADSVVESDADLLCESFNNSVAIWLTDWNYPGAAYPKVHRKLEPEEDLKASAERDKIIVDMGFPANPEYIVEKYGEGFKLAESELKPNLLNTTELTAFTALIGQAQSGGWSPEMVKVSLEIAFPHVPQELIDKMANSMKAVVAASADPNNLGSPAPNPQTPEQAAKSLDDVAAQFAEQPDPIDPILTQLKPIADATFTEWFTTLQGMMNESDNLVEFRDKLTDAYPDLNAAEFKQAMLDASVVAGMQGYSDASDSESSFSMSDEEVEFKLPEGKTKVVSGTTYVLINSRWHVQERGQEPDNKPKVERIVTPHVMTENTDEVLEPLPGESAKSLERRTDAFRQQKWGAELVALDVNQVSILPKISEKDWDKTIEKLKQLPENHVIAFHPDNTDLFQELFIRSVKNEDGRLLPIGKVSKGKIVSADGDRAKVKAIRDARTLATGNMEAIHSDDNGDMRATAGMTKEQITAGRNINGKVFPYGKKITKTQKDRILDKENAYHIDIDKLENEYFNRQPTGKHGNYDQYSQRADKWARDKFGDFDEGANGFSLAQTKAHDIAHPVTHDLLGMDSDAIHANLGKLTDAAGNNALYAEEAIVNVMEQLSRGVTIEAAILNGVRLAKVMTRSGVGSPESAKYVRTPQFAQALGSLANKAYRHDDFAPLIAHVRKSNRISGTVMAAGDNFSNTASGG